MKLQSVCLILGLLWNTYHVKSTGEGEVRLTGGDGYRKGTVEIYHDFSWGIVCDDGWDTNDANVVCRQLGLGPAITSRDRAFFGTGHGTILLDNVACYGTEFRLDQCLHNGWYNHDCDISEAAGVECSYPVYLTTSQYWTSSTPQLSWTTGSVRLQGGSSRNEGRVEVYWQWQWYTVCDGNWDITDATVVCRQLGYPAASTAVLRSGFGAGGNAILLDEVMCTGYESSLIECSNDGLFVHDCSRFEIAGVVCSTVSPNNVRLAGGSSFNSGRVELYYDGSWGTLCDDLWDNEEANVICRQLGFAGADNVYSSAYFGAGSGPILYNLQCAGNEYQWMDCYFSNWGSTYCSHEEDAGVTCRIETLYSTTPLYWPTIPVRLQDGSSSNEGRVEVYWQWQWYTVCDDNWDITDATVVCRQLGYPAASAVVLESGFGAGEGDILLDEVMCTGYESSLIECSNEGLFVHDCSRNEIAGVVCSTATTPYPHTVRLTGGSTLNSGRVELYYDGSWGTLCDDFWDNEDANVICRQLGFAGADNVYSSAYFGAGSGPILYNLQCAGKEDQWMDCYFSNWGSTYCSHEEDAGVTCRIEDSNEGDVRLIGASSENEGRVEIYHYGTWGTVCDDDWDINDAEVVCNQLGFPGALMALDNSYFGQGTDPILLDDVSCKGDEHYLTDCTHNGWYDHDCSHIEDAGVRCNMPNIYYPRLVDGDQLTEGRVEIWNGNQWTKLCANDGFWENEANVICKELGFDGVDHIIYSGRFGEGESPPSDVFFSCTSYEDSLFECDQFSRSEYDCTYSALRCQYNHPLSVGAIIGTVIGVVIFIILCSVCCVAIYQLSKPKTCGRQNPLNVAIISGSTNPAGPTDHHTSEPALLPMTGNVQAPPTYNDVLINPGYYPNIAFNTPAAGGHVTHQ